MGIMTFIAIAVQLGIVFYVLKCANILSNFFPNQFEKQSDNEQLLTSSNSSTAFKNFTKDINDYLRKNKGTPDFTILQNKTERTLAGLYDKAASMAAFPTYIGLLFTFGGVAFGLMNFGVAENLTNTESVIGLINGVKTAMWTSFSGLLLTIILQMRLANVRANVSNRKNDFYNFLQNELLPHLNKDMPSMIASLREVIGGIDGSFKSITTDLVSTFSGITKQFGDEFQSNVSAIHQAVSIMGTNMGQINESTELQRQLLKEIGTTKFNNTISQMYNLANRYDQIAESTTQFATLQVQLNEGTESMIKRQTQFIELLDTPKELVEDINILLNRFHKFEENIETIGEEIIKSQGVGANLIQSVERQLETINKRSAYIDKQIETSEEEIRNYITVQNEGFKRLVQSNITNMQTTDEELQKEFKESSTLFNASVKKHFDALTDSINPETVIARLSLLENLTALKKMDALEGIEASQTKLLDKMYKIDEVVVELRSMKGALQNVRQRSGNNGIPPTQPPKRNWVQKLLRLK